MLPVIEIQTFKTKLPSSGKNIKFRPMIVKEEKILLSAMESKDKDEMKAAVAQIISNCTFDKLNIQDMAILDIEWLFLQLRIKSKGQKAEYSFKCDECNVVNEREADLSKVEIINKDYNDVINLTSDIGIKMKAPNYAIAESLSSDMNVDDIFSVIVGSIDLIYEGDEVHKASDESKEDLLEWIESLSDSNFKKIKDYFDNLPSMEMIIDFSCTGCKKENSIVLKGLNDFLQ